MIASQVTRAHLTNPHGREADAAGWAARREECDVVIPLKRRATPQRTRRVASRTGFGAQARKTSLRALPMTTGTKEAEREDLKRLLVELETLSDEQAQRLLSDEDESSKASGR